MTLGLRPSEIRIKPQQWEEIECDSELFLTLILSVDWYFSKPELLCIIQKQIAATDSEKLSL